MKPHKWIGLLLVLIPAFATIQGKPKKPDRLPAIFNQARTVYVEAVDGQKFDPALIQEDRQAIVDVEGALHHWSRYVVVLRRDKADLIFVVSKGRPTSAGARGSLDPQGDMGSQGCDESQGGNGRQGRNSPQAANGPQNAPGQPDCAPGPGSNVALGSETGPADDLLEVFVRNSDQSRGAPLWAHARTGGLDRPDLELFKQFKDQVEQDYPPQASDHAAKP